MEIVFKILVFLTISPIYLMLLNLESCFESKLSKKISNQELLKQQPPKQQLEKDGEQIVESYINMIEMYRQLLLAESEDAFEPTNFYEPYANRYTLDGKEIASPFPIYTQLKVTADTIVYSKNHKFCVALLILKSNYSQIEGIENENSDFPYDACAVIGYRQNDKEPYKLYPITKYKVIGVGTYADAKEIIRESYFKNLKKTYAGYSLVFNGAPLGYNIGDPQFFEKSPYFQKYDSLRYNFQMYHYYGEDHKFPQPTKDYTRITIEKPQ